MKTQEEICALERLKVNETSYDGGCGFLYFPGQREPMFVIWSFGEGWEHVSVSYRKRMPTWEEMCKVKNMYVYPQHTYILLCFCCLKVFFG